MKIDAKWKAGSAWPGKRPEKAAGSVLHSLRGRGTDRLCSHVVCSGFALGPSGLVVSSGESCMSSPETRCVRGWERPCSGDLVARGPAYYCSCVHRGSAYFYLGRFSF